MLDEPNDKKSYENVLTLGKLVHEGAPQLQRLVVEQPYTQDPAWPDIDPAVDIWCPLFSFIGREEINEKLSHGDEVWSYTALAQRAPNYYSKYTEVKNYDPPYWAIDQPLTSYRIPTWINLQYKINGYLYWSTVYSDKSITGVMDPWFLPIYSASGKHFSGEGYLLYPGKPCGINGPVASIRLKNMRDGMEDYEYFASYIRRESRYVLDARRHEFLEAVAETSRKRTTTIPQGQLLWRAAQGYVAEGGVHPHDVFFLESIEPLAIERMVTTSPGGMVGGAGAPAGAAGRWIATGTERFLGE